jgi:hypothetical protein
MNKVAGIVVALFAFAFLAFFIVARGVQSRMGSATGGPYSYLGPGWEKLDAASRKGKAGWPDLQSLMTDPNSALAYQALQQLVTTGDHEAYDLVLERLPTVASQTRSDLRHSWLDPAFTAYAAKAVREREPKTWQGALLYLKLNYSRDAGYGPQDQAFKDLVAGIPHYDGAEADELAYTISLFVPRSVSPLTACLQDEKPRVRQTAVVALGKMGRVESLPDIEALQTDPDPDVRRAAAQALKSAKASPVTVTHRTTPGGGSTTSVTTNGQAPDRNDPAEREKSKKRLGMP